MGRMRAKSSFKRAVLCGNRSPRSKFKKTFQKEIAQFIESIFLSYKLYKIIDKHTKGDMRRTWVVAQLYNSIQSLVSAFNIFISGYIVPSGNLMRHFHESVAMAILLSNDKVKYFEKFIKDPAKFKVNEVFKFVEENLTSFAIEQSGWEAFVKIKNFYHQFSHASAVAMASSVHFGSSKGKIALGSSYDDGKTKQYRIEILRMISAAHCLQDIIQGITQQLKIKTK